jgi:hypothetical protein
MQLGSNRELAQTARAQMRRKVHPGPDRLLDGGGMIVVDPSRDVQNPGLAALHQRQSIGLAVGERAQVGMVKPV